MEHIDNGSPAGIPRLRPHRVPSSPTPAEAGVGGLLAAKIDAVAAQWALLPDSHPRFASGRAMLARHRRAMFRVIPGGAA